MIILQSTYTDTYKYWKLCVHLIMVQFAKKQSDQSSSSYCDSEGVYTFGGTQSAIAIDTQGKRVAYDENASIRCAWYALEYICIWLSESMMMMMEMEKISNWLYRCYMLFITFSSSIDMCDVVKYTKPSICICFRVSWWCRFHCNIERECASSLLQFIYYFFFIHFPISFSSIHFTINWLF